MRELDPLQRDTAVVAALPGWAPPRDRREDPAIRGHQGDPHGPPTVADQASTHTVAGCAANAVEAVGGSRAAVLQRLPAALESLEGNHSGSLQF